MIRDPKRHQDVVEVLKDLRERLDHPGASRKAAVEIVKFAETYRGVVPDGGSQWPAK